MRFNIIGFDFPNSSRITPDKYKHCVVHPGSRLISKPDEPGMLMCPLCGTSYLPKDSISEERFDPSVTPKTQTRIITPTKSKKSLINRLMKLMMNTTQNIANGANVISYTEVKSGKERTVVKRRKYCRDSRRPTV